MMTPSMPIHTVCSSASRLLSLALLRALVPRYESYLFALLECTTYEVIGAHDYHRIMLMYIGAGSDVRPITDLPYTQFLYVDALPDKPHFSPDQYGYPSTRTKHLS